MDRSDLLLDANEVRFRRTAEGRIVMRHAGEEREVGGLAAAFPLTSPRRFVSIRDLEGQEIALLDDARALEAASWQIVKKELERSYFMPRISAILALRETLNVTEWEVRTTRGARTFYVRNVRKNVRRIGPRRIVIRDVDGNRYEVRDWTALPPASLKLLEPYL